LNIVTACTKLKMPESPKKELSTKLSSLDRVYLARI
jgi:hypothetical protein